MIRLIETDERVDTANDGVLGGKLTRRGAERLRRDHPAPVIPATPMDMPMYRMEIEKVGGWRWDRWLVVCYQNRLEDGD